MKSHAPALDPTDPALIALVQALVARAPAESASVELDEHASQLVQEFLDLQGWSARDLAARTDLIAKERQKPTLTVSRKTIDRVLDGHIPRARAKAAIALVMGVPPWKIWGAGQMPLAHQREQILNTRTEVLA